MTTEFVDKDYGLPHTLISHASVKRLVIEPNHPTMTVFGSRLVLGTVSLSELPRLKAQVLVSTPYTESVPHGQRLFAQSHSWFTTLN
jgi:hypothetical protein